MRMTRLSFGVAMAAACVVSSSAPATVIDPFGDAQDTFGAGRPLLDIDTISVVYDAFFIHFEMTFHTPISAPSLGQPNGVIGFFEFDTDQDSRTGIAPLQNTFSPPFAFLNAGVDFYVELSSEAVHPGFVDIIDANVGIVDVVPITYGPMSFSGSISLATLGGDDGLLGFTSIIGTFPQPTDAMDVIGKSKLPAPGALTLLGVASLCGARRRRRE